VKEATKMCECEEGKCSCSNECNEQKCGNGGGCCSEGQYDKLDMFLYMAKGAKMELLKEKMKLKVEAAAGKKLDKVADLIVGSLMERYKAEGEASSRKQELNEKLEKIFEEE
jgi:hypothetical protein